MMRIFGKRRSWTMSSVIKILLLVLCLFFGLLVIAWNNQNVYFQVRRALSTEDIIDKKKILLWNSMFEDDWYRFGDRRHFDNCPKYRNCYMTRSRWLVDEDEFDAILFHGNEVERNDKPKNRNPRQLYVFVNLVSPRNRPLPDSTFENVFNLTMTYKLDSDIPWPYYLVRNIDTGEVLAPFKNVDWMEPSYDPMRWYTEFNFETKNKMIAWLVNNCETWGRRELLANELEKYMKIDRIGKCNLPVARECAGPAETCFREVIEPNYFFYLAFENSLCEEYVTEKFFNALSHDIIPVVYGGANYSVFAPPHSYIDALDFDNPKALADFLIDLSQDREEYLKYFWWKRFYTVGSPNQWTLCKLCERINDESQLPKSYSPLSDWYLKDECPIQKLLNGRNYATREIRNRLNTV